MTSTMSVVAVQMCLPIKSSLHKLFFCSVLKQSNLFKGTVISGPQVAVIFHVQAHEGERSDTVIHLRGTLQ